jgi:hypothetical protein
MKTLLTLLLLLFSITGYGAGTVVKKIESIRGNVRTSEGAGTTTLTSSDAKEQIFNLSAARTVLLPTTNVKAGEKWILKNVATTTTAALTIQSSGANTLGYNNSADAVVECAALQNTPTSAAHWQCLMNFSSRSYTCTTGSSPTYNNGVAITVSSTQTINSVHHCTIIPYQMIDGEWRAKIAIGATYAGNPGNLNFNGLTPNMLYFGTGVCVDASYQDIGSFAVISGPPWFRILKWDGTAYTRTVPACYTEVRLSSRPTWAF